MRSLKPQPKKKPRPKPQPLYNSRLVKMFTETTYPNARTRSLFFVHFYNTGNSACKKATKIILALAEALNLEGAMSVGAVDCRADSSTCSRAGANRQPAFGIVVGDKTVIYKGPSPPSKTVRYNFLATYLHSSHLLSFGCSCVVPSLSSCIVRHWSDDEL